MSSYGHTYLTSYGWTGAGTGLRNGAIAKPLAIPPKKNLSGLGKDRDEAFPFWDHLFTAASRAITIRVSSDDEDEDTEDDQASPDTDFLRRTTTGIISNRRPTSGTPVSTSGNTTPNPITDTSRLSLVATAKREAARRGLYARFFRGPVLGPDDDLRETDVSDVSSPSSAAVPTATQPHEQDKTARNTKKNEKRKLDLEAEEERRTQKRLKKERKAARAAKRAEKASARDKEKSRPDAVDRKERKTPSEENDASSKKAPKRAKKSLLEFAPTQQDTSRRPLSHADTSDTLSIGLAMKKKGKRKDTS